MALSLEQLQAFVGIVEQGGIKQAGRSLGKHASTLREQLSNLEIDTGLDLFIRHARSLELTAEGQELYDYAKAILRETEHFQTKVESLAQGEPTQLTVAIDTALREPNLTRILAELLDNYPNLQLKVLNGDTLQVRSWLLSEQADLGLMFGTFRNPHELMVSRAYSFEVIRVAPCQWADQQVTDMGQLRGQRQISFSFFEALDSKSADILSHRVLYANNAYQILEMVKAGMGFAHLPRFFCQRAVANGEVMELGIENEKNSYWYTNLVWQASKPLNAAMQQFIDAVIALPDR